MDNPIFTVTEADLQAFARDRIGRELTDDELDSAIHRFQKGMDCCDWQIAEEIAIDEAVAENK